MRTSRTDPITILVRAPITQLRTGHTSTCPVKRRGLNEIFEEADRIAGQMASSTLDFGQLRVPLKMLLELLRSKITHPALRLAERLT